MLLTEILYGSWMSYRALSGCFALDRKMVETLFYQQNTVGIFVVSGNCHNVVSTKAVVKNSKYFS